MPAKRKAASPKDSTADLEKRLWDAANKLWANLAAGVSNSSPSH